MTDTRILTGRDIGVAEAATRAVLETLLAKTGTTFHQWVALNLVAGHGEVMEQQRLANEMVGGLKIHGATAVAAINELVDLELLARRPAEPTRIEMTQAGADHHRLVQHEIDRTTDRLYRDLAPDDLVTARRVLVTLTERATPSWPALADRASLRARYCDRCRRAGQVVRERLTLGTARLVASGPGERPAR